MKTLLASAASPIRTLRSLKRNLSQDYAVRLFERHFLLYLIASQAPRPGGSVVSVSDTWPIGCEFDPRLRRTFFPAYFRLSPLLKHVRKVVGGIGKRVVLVLE